MYTILFLAETTSEIQTIQHQLNQIGYRVILVDNVLQALMQIEQKQIDIMMLDLAIPNMDALWLLLTHKGQVPIITLANHDTTIEKIAAFEMGADDYLHKPYNTCELQLRLKVLQRRMKGKVPVVRDTLTFNDDTFSIQYGDNLLTLTRTEFNLFKYLYERPGEVISKAELQQSVLHKKFGKYDRNLDMHISNTRKKMAMGNIPTDLINTIRGRGYCFSF